MDSRVEAVIATIERDFADCTMNSERLAAVANLSPSRLHHVFKAETGKALMLYLRSIRMREAATLLAISNLSVKELAHRVGYKSYSHFIHDFKREHGIPPGRYQAIVTIE
jgi:AraC family transcriptional regulator of arabinose operon